MRPVRVALAVALLAGHTAMASELDPLPEPVPAPAIRLADLDGRVHDLGDYRGRVVLVNFWATWCRPCVAEMPALNRLRESDPSDPPIVLVISNDEPVPRVRHFRARLQLELVFLLDRGSSVGGPWQVSLLPASFVLDRSGRIRYHALGEVDWDHPETRRLIRELAAEPVADSQP